MVLPFSAHELPLLSQVDSPDDLKLLTSAEVIDLAQEIRSYLISSVSRTGGHLGPNLGVVELTLAIHRVFRSPVDTVVYDTGHQAYVHKLLTGRKDFSHLRQANGLSGYPSRKESPHDVVENSHASASLSWIDGISREKQRRSDTSWSLAVIGDGALTGGMAWEALNNIAENPDRRVIIIVNDNGRSYAPTIGGMAHHLDALRTSEGYERTLSWTKRTLLNLGDPGRAAFEALHGLKAGVKDIFAPQILFEDLGLKYLGPIDGHDVVAMETALRRARGLNRAVIVHAITEKGRGYIPAEEDVADRFHAVGKIHPETGLPIKPARFGWTSVFADELVKIARTRDDVVAITAAMRLPVGLGPLSDEFPDRVVDVGISEQHAVAAAAGMAKQGAHPVVAVYATFMTRAVDQALMDVGLHHAGVTFVLDRAGITGEDGASHNGIWDIPLLQVVPGIRIASPRDENTLRKELQEAIDISNAPTVLRYGKGSLPPALEAHRSVGTVDVVYEADNARVLIVAVGSLVQEAMKAAESLERERINVTIVDPRWILPISQDLVEVISAHPYDLIVTAEDGIREGGFGWALRDAVDQAGINTPVEVVGIPKQFLHHGTQKALKKELMLDSNGIAARISRRLQALSDQ